MAEHTAPMTVILQQGRAFVAVGDIVKALLEMADSIDAAPQAGADALRKLAGAFARATGSDGELFHLPAPPPQPCPNCSTPTHTCDQLAGGTLVLNAEATSYGRWIICIGGDGRQIAAKYDVGKHARVNCSRYREHACPGLS